MPPERTHLERNFNMQRLIFVLLLPLMASLFLSAAEAYGQKKSEEQRKQEALRLSEACERMGSGWKKPETCSSCSADSLCAPHSEALTEALRVFEERWDSSDPYRQVEGIRELTHAASAHGNALPAAVISSLRKAIGSREHDLVRATGLHALGNLGHADSLFRQVHAILKLSHKDLERHIRAEKKILKKKIGDKRVLDWLNLRKPPQRHGIQAMEDFMEELENLAELTLKQALSGAIYHGSIRALAAMTVPEAMEVLIRAAEDCPNWEVYGAIFFAAWDKDDQVLWEAILRKLESLEKMVGAWVENSETLGREMPPRPDSWKQNERSWQAYWELRHGNETAALNAELGDEVRWIRGIHHGLSEFAQKIEVAAPEVTEYDHHSGWARWFEQRFPSGTGE